MNDNAFNQESTIKVTKTMTGKIPDNVGFSKTDGPIMPLEDQLKEMEKNGLIVERTPNGIFISKPITNDNKKRTTSKKRNPRRK
jgi:hypothetical protein